MPENPSRRIRTVVSGFGFMGQTHCGTLISDQSAEMAAIIDPCDPAERLRVIRGNQQTVTISPEEVKKTAHFQDLVTALDTVKPDAAVIAVPTRFHFSSVMECLKRNIHVFVEKPLSLSPEECRLMVKTAAENNVILAVGYVVRSIPSYRFLKETIGNKRLGNLKLLRLHREAGFPAWGNWNDPEFLRASGGALFDLQTHDVDIARFCLGEPAKITAIAELSRPAEGNLQTAVLDYGSCRAIISGGFVTPSTYPFSCGFSAFFEQGSLKWDSISGTLLEITPEKTSVVPLEEKDPYQEELRRFIRAVKGESTVICDGQDAAKTMDICVEIHRQLLTDQSK